RGRAEKRAMIGKGEPSTGCCARRPCATRPWATRPWATRPWATRPCATRRWATRPCAACRVPRAVRRRSGVPVRAAVPAPRTTPSLNSALAIIARPSYGASEDRRGRAEKRAMIGKGEPSGERQAARGKRERRAASAWPVRCPARPPRASACAAGLQPCAAAEPGGDRQPERQLVPRRVATVKVLLGAAMVRPDHPRGALAPARTLVVDHPGGGHEHVLPARV